MSGSLSSLTKGLTSVFSTTHPRLESEILALVQAYIDRHTPASENDRHKLQVELLEIYRHHVKPENSAAFLHILTLLRHDFIIDSEACATWWALLLSPILNHSELLKSTLRDALSICMDTMTPKDEDDHFKTRYAAADAFKAGIFESFFQAMSSNRIRVADNLQHLLLKYARTRTKEYFEAIDPFVQDPTRRLHTFTLLSSFVRLQTQYIYQITETPLLNSLLLCLEHDTSTTVVSLALTILIMIMPHIPNKLEPMLVRLFNVFGRISCWDRLHAVQRRTNALVEVEKADWNDTSRQMPQHEEQDGDGQWRRLDASFDGGSSTPPKCSQYFTFLYGLYPVNFLAYLQDPSGYAQESGVTMAINGKDGADDETIRTRAEPFVRRHLVHPNLTMFTRAMERSDMSRWMKLEPSDVVTMCISLDTINVDHDSKLVLSPLLDQDIATFSLDASFSEESKFVIAKEPDDTGIKGMPSVASKHEQDSILDDLEDTLVTENQEVAGSRLASPAFAPKLVSHSIRQVPSMSRQSSTSRKSMFNPQEMLQMHEQLLLKDMSISRESNSAKSPGLEDSRASLSFYHRELLLLKNELRFERHLRQQHLQHIGRLQRDRMSDAALESERQNLYNTTKALKNQVSNLQNILKNLRSEQTTSKANRAQYEASLNDRIKKLREEKSIAQNEAAALEGAVNLARRDVNNMQTALGIAEGQALNLKQQLQVLEPEIQETKDLRNNFDLLKSKIKEAEVQDLQLRMERERVLEAQAETKATMMRYEALRQEFEQHIDATKKELMLGREQLGPAIPSVDVAKADELVKKLTVKLSTQVKEIESLRERQGDLIKINAELKTRNLDLEAAKEAESVSERYHKARQETPSVHKIMSDAPSSTAGSLRGRDSLAMPGSPSLANLANNAKVYESEDNVHGARRPQPLGLISKTSARSVSSTTLTSKEMIDKAARAGSASPTIKTKDSKERSSLGGRFRW